MVIKCLVALLSVTLVVLAGADAKADDENSLRISRPTFRMPEELRFTIGRERLGLNHFAMWTRNYLRPVVCTSVLCGGSCSAYLDACPSFTGLAVLDFSQDSNEISTTDSQSGSGVRCPVNVPRGLVASGSCGSNESSSNSCDAGNEGSMKGSCCNH